MTRLLSVACVGALVGLALTVPAAAQAASFHVTRSDDPSPIGPCDADCSLREAVVAANGNGNPGVIDEIDLPAGTYALTDKPAATGDSAAVTDLDITQALTITGAGASSTTINASQLAGSQAAIQAGTNAQTIELVDVTVSGGDASGIQNTTSVALTLTRSAVVGNTGGSTGGGIDANSGSSLTLTETTVSGNQASNGGGVYIAINATITNSTFSGNTVTAEGGGVYVEFGTTSITNSTIAFNTGPANGGGGIANFDVTNLKNTIVSDNTGGNCDTFDPPTSLGNNIEDTSTCGLGASGDKPSTDPALGPLTDNGGETQTHALGGASPAIDAAGSCPPPSTDQRGTPRPQRAACDMGAYELVTSRTVPTVPDCSPTGAIPLQMNAPGETPVAFHYKVDDGPTQDVPTTDNTGTVNLPEGSFKFEYWSETQEAGQEPQADHQIGTALVDKTAPGLSVSSDQNQSLYVIKRNATVTVDASDALSGLTSNPSAQGESVPTDSRGTKTVEWTAVDLCDNRATEQLSYTVLGPGLGERAVIEPLGDGVEIDLPGTAGAHVSQKGADFEPVTQPREIPIGTTIDANEAGARITSSKSTTEGDIKDGTFQAGVFQVLESRNQEKNALTRLQLKGGSFKNCEAGEGASAARLSRRAIRRLRGSATGRFRTRGRHSAATVRGTDWDVIDRCDGTLTKVERGEVAVRDFRLRKTIVVKEGKRYLARAEAPDPVFGKRVTVDAVKGKVFIKLPRGGKFARASQKGTEFEPLTSERSIPVRSILDTTRGTVALRSARNKKGAIQSGRFAAGVFQVLQSRKRREKGLTTLRLTGSAAKFKRCGSGKRSSESAHASLTRRQIRRLRARARGRYRTSGRYSAATVRGTTWTVTDRCDGTLTTVRRGKVTVRDFRKKRTITLTAGKSYLAGPG